MRDAGARVIVAVTHLELITDRSLAERYPELALIVGSHDHAIVHTTVGGTVIAKVDANGMHVGRLDLRVSTEPTISVEVDWKPVAVLSDEIPPDPAMAALVARYEGLLEPFREPIGKTVVPLDALTGHVRTRETNVGNLVADIVRREGEADVAIVNGGGFRSNRVVVAGAGLTVGDVWELYPWEDRVVAVEVSGRTLRAALEGGVTRWEEQDGAFPQVSGMSFTFDPGRPPGRRIVEVMIGSEPLEEGKKYRLATVDYLVSGGGDRYGMLTSTSAETYRRVADVIVEAIRTAGTIAPRVEGRIVNLRDPLAETTP